MSKMLLNSFWSNVPLHGTLRGMDPQGLGHGLEGAVSTLYIQLIDTQSDSLAGVVGLRGPGWDMEERRPQEKKRRCSGKIPSPHKNPLSSSELYQLGPPWCPLGLHCGSKDNFPDCCPYISWPLQAAGHAPYFHSTTTLLGTDQV